MTPVQPQPAGSRGRPRRYSLWLGGALLIALVIACVGTLPWTLSRGQDGMPRYNAGTASAGRLPPFWAANDPAPPLATDAPAPPHFFLGSDVLGRSVLLRCLAGGGLSMTIGVCAALISVIIGTLYGAASGYAGGKTDTLMMRIVDVLYGLPYVLLVVLLAVASDAAVDEYVSRQRGRDSLMRQLIATSLQASGDAHDSAAVRKAIETASPTAAQAAAEAAAQLPPRRLSSGARQTLDLATLLIAIGGVSWLTMARVIRAQVLSLKNQPFVLAARAIGASPGRIFFRHLLPNLTGTITVYATLTVPQAILQESFLSFLGIGVKPPLPSWGTLASEGLGELNPYASAWWLLVFPCALLGITLLALNFVGEGLRRTRLGGR